MTALLPSTDTSTPAGVGPVVLFDQNPSLQYTWVAPPAPGFEPERLVGHRDDDVFRDKDEADIHLSTKKRVLRTGEVERRVLPVTTEETTRLYDCTFVPRRDASESVIGISGAAVDVTQLKHRENELRQDGQRAEVARAVARRSQEQAERARDEALQAKAEADRARRYAEEAREAKTTFLAGVAHDIRSPLSVLQGSLEMIEEARQNHDTNQIIRHAVEQLLTLAESLSELAQFDRPASLSIQHANVRPLVESVLTSLRGHAEEQDLVLNAEMSDVKGRVNPGAVRRITDNLVGNAIKHGTPGTQITVRLFQEQGPTPPDSVGATAVDTAPRDASSPDASPDSSSEANTQVLDPSEKDASEIGTSVHNSSVDDPTLNANRIPEGTFDEPGGEKTQGGVVLIVEDTGPGISESSQRQIFDPFVQADETKEGSGLGLAITRQLVTAMGGDIRLDSEVGCGTRFIVRLPGEAMEDSA